MSNVQALKQLNIMILLTMFNQLLLLIMNALAASYYGVSAEMDAFNLAKNISNFIFSFIGAGVSTIIIPYLKDKINNKGLNIFISIIYTVGLFFVIILIIFRYQIIPVISGIQNHAFIEIVAKVFIFTVISSFLNSIIQLFKALLEFKGKFNIQKLIVVFITILSVILLWINQNATIYYYAGLLLLTTVISVMMHLLLIKTEDYKFKLNYNYDNKEFKGMLKLFFPIVLSTGVYQLSLLIDTLIASRLGVGIVSIIAYASTINSMINMLLLGNLTSFFYPRLVKKSNNRLRQNSLFDYLILINTIMLCVLILIITVGREGITVLFERGEFTTENTHKVYLCALIYALSLPTNGMRDLLYRYFYINKDTFSPFLNSILISFFNIIISLILVQYFNLYGIVLGTVIASFVSLILISFRFSNRFEVYFDLPKLLIEIFKSIISTIITLIIIIYLKSLIPIENEFLAVLIYSISLVSVFIVLLKLFRSKVFEVSL